MKFTIIAMVLVLPGCLSADEVWNKVDDVPAVSGDSIVITMVDPDHGTTAGGNLVTIGAEPIGDTVQVYFDGQRADVDEFGTNGVRAYAPPGSEGSVDIEVWSGAAYGVAEGAYRYER